MICLHPSRPTGRRGFTLIEMLVVLVLMGIMATMAGPRLVNWARVVGQRGALNELVADLSLARTQAVRQGQTVSLRVTDATHYRVTVDNAAGNVVRTLKTVDLGATYKGTRLTQTTGRVSFDSRGMFRTSSTFDNLGVRQGTTTKTVRISVVGRIYRD
ncbi:MAG TPA: GspH/FimT family pseudopilin [Longimicrobium sp.]|nr:GspH/FimT family pseudopilin [Longimicrobium sp.]